MPGHPATPLATLGARTAARAVDSIVVVLFSGALALVAVGGDVQDGAPGWLRLATVGFGLLYEGLFVARSGETPGKRLAGIRVVDGTTGAVPDLGRSLVRGSPYLLALLPVLGSFWWLPLLAAVWRPRRQGWHDVAAGTIVVSTRAAATTAGGYPSS